MTGCGALSLVKRIAHAAGIEKNVYPHLFRHTRISDLVKKEKDSRRVKLISGHLSDQSFSVYTHYSAQDAIDVIYPELAEEKTSKPLLTPPVNLLPDTRLEQLVREIVDRRLSEALSQMKLEAAGLPKSAPASPEKTAESAPPSSDEET